MSNFCITYNRLAHFKYLEEIPELVVNFNPKDKTLKDFLLKYSEKRVIIYIKEVAAFREEKQIELFKAFKEANITNYILQLYQFADTATKELYQELKELEIPYFFSDKIDSIDKLHEILAAEPTDVYITNELGFCLKDIHQVCQKCGVRVRVIPNLAQSTAASTPALLKFFIRPEDIPLYSEYVDTFEILEPTFKRQNTYYKIYTKDKKWSGQLREMIMNFTEDHIDSRFIMPLFGKRRLNCHKRCQYGGKCQTCSAIADVADVLKDKKVYFKYTS